MTVSVAGPSPGTVIKDAGRGVFIQVVKGPAIPTPPPAVESATRDARDNPPLERAISAQ